MPTEPPAIRTIGHSTLSFDGLVALLKEADIELLVDIRHYPGSRRMPWFNKDVLAKCLAEVGIGYAHIEALGGRRRPDPDSRNTVWRHAAFRGYADHMLNDPAFEQGLERLKALAAKQRTCMMCSEVLWWRCHRALVADRLKADGWRVWHIMGPGKEVEHPWSAAARLQDGKLFYGPVELDQPFARDADRR